MSVVVKLAGEREFVIIELQGEVKHEIERLDGAHLGSLIEAREGQYELHIGNHILRGKKEKLDRPIAVLRKEADGLNVEGLVHFKLLFKDRPAPNIESAKMIKPTNLNSIFNK